MTRSTRPVGPPTPRSWLTSLLHTIRGWTACRRLERTATARVLGGHRPPVRATAWCPRTTLSTRRPSGRRSWASICAPATRSRSSAKPAGRYRTMTSRPGTASGCTDAIAVHAYPRRLRAIHPTAYMRSGGTVVNAGRCAALPRRRSSKRSQRTPQATLRTPMWITETGYTTSTGRNCVGLRHHRPCRPGTWPRHVQLARCQTQVARLYFFQLFDSPPAIADAWRTGVLNYGRLPQAVLVSRSTRRREAAPHSPRTPAEAGYATGRNEEAAE